MIIIRVLGAFLLLGLAGMIALTWVGKALPDGLKDMLLIALGALAGALAPHRSTPENKE